MQQNTQQERAEAFHRRHAGDGIIVLVNAWDAASARLLEQAGSPAIATTSAGVAWSLGYSDGEQVSARELILEGSEQALPKDITVRIGGVSLFYRKMRKG